MNKVEKRLLDEKNRLYDIQAPDELEMKLKEVLDAKVTKKPKRLAPIAIVAAMALFMVIFVGYQYDALAIYGKKLLGFDEVITGSLKELNDQGMGQLVDKKVVLSDGTEFIVDGIMADANQFVMYYTIRNEKGLEFDILSFSKMTGFFTHSSPVSGTGIKNDERTEIKGVQTFESVSPLSNELTVNFWEYDGEREKIEGSISFPYDAKAALRTQFQQKIDKTVKVDQGTITFKRLTATPTMTSIEGVVHVANFDKTGFGLSGIELIANGEPIRLTGSGHSSSLSGREFSVDFDALPQPLYSLELKLSALDGYELLNKKILLSNSQNEKIMLKEHSLEVKNVSVTSDGVEITIATESDVVLDGVFIESNDGVKTELRTTVGEHHIERDGRALKERTLLFNTNEKPAFLLIKGLHYIKEYGDVIKIPIE